MQRMAGFELLPVAQKAGGGPTTRDRQEFADFYKWLDGGYKYYRNPGDPPAGRQWTCTGPVSYSGAGATAEDIANLAAAVKAVKVEEAFLPATSPLSPGRNAHYKDDRSFNYAIADAMRNEYRAIVDAGLIVQIDDPRMPGLWDQAIAAMSVAQYRKVAEAHVE